MWLPQRIAAVPAYINSGSKDSFKEAAPGHKFLGYLRNTQGDNGTAFAPYKGKAKIIGNPPSGQPRRDANAEQKQEFDGVLNEVCDRFPTASLQQIEALRARQHALHTHYGTNAYRISAKSTAPFATGLGNEHPIENGFAFLTPYGLPYLAGSGVKGILRRAMQDLCQERGNGFTDETIDALFGPEKIDVPEDAQRGALDFWDVFPNPAGSKLVVEIMTPHHGGYYQKNETPHDSGAPVPVSFLAVPAKSQFDFHVICQPSRLPAALQDQWRTLLDRAFAHAFEWVGFGAKTSVGYGAMAASDAAPTKAAAQTTSAGQIAPATKANSATLDTWPTAKLTLNPGTGEVTASFEGKSTSALKNPQANELRAVLGEERANKLKKNKEIKGVSVDVEILGNALILKCLTPL